MRLLAEAEAGNSAVIAAHSSSVTRVFLMVMVPFFGGFGLSLDETTEKRVTDCNFFGNAQDMEEQELFGKRKRREKLSLHLSSKSRHIKKHN